MKGHLFIGVFLASLVFLTESILRADPVVLPQYGFQIDPLDAPVTHAPAQALMMFLPATKGSTPNVSVQIQPFEGDMKSYVALSSKQISQSGVTVLSENSKIDNEWTVEYTGPVQGAVIHWYVRAVLYSGKIYLVTATSKDENWAEVSDALKKCVDSFKNK